MISPGNEEDFTFEQSSLRIDDECTLGEKTRRMGYFWSPLQMGFKESSGVICYCIRLHTYCIESCIKLDNTLRNDNATIEFFPGLILLAPSVNAHGVPLEHLRRDCRCKNCSKGTRSRF